jgi:hypothetical protein
MLFYGKASQRLYGDYVILTVLFCTFYPYHVNYLVPVRSRLSKSNHKVGVRYSSFGLDQIDPILITNCMQILLLRLLPATVLLLGLPSHPTLYKS